jgi:hypothetical protein
MAKVPSSLIEGLENSVAKKAGKGPAVPQRQANRFANETNKMIVDAGLHRTYRPVEAKAHIMQRRADRTYGKSQALLDAAGKYGDTVGSNRKGRIRPEQQMIQGEGLRMYKKGERQAAKADLYRQRITKVDS